MAFLPLLIPDDRPYHKSGSRIRTKGREQAGKLGGLDPAILVQQGDPDCTQLTRSGNPSVEAAGNTSLILIADKDTLLIRQAVTMAKLRIIVYNYEPKAGMLQRPKVVYPVAGRPSVNRNDNSMETALLCCGHHSVLRHSQRAPGTCSLQPSLARYQTTVAANRIASHGAVASPAHW
jgi:hypothetical protein